MKKNSKTSSYGISTRIRHDASQYYNARMNQEICFPTVHKKNSAISEKPFPQECENTIIHSSAVSMTAIPDKTVHLMVTSPPYNVTKEYDTDLSLQEYLDLLTTVFTETYRVLVHGGRACINIANLGRKPYIPVSDFISQIMLKIGFLMRGEIIWYKGAGAGVSMAWGSWKSASNPVLRDTHEYILVFSKGDFSRRKSVGQENTITKEQFMEWTKSVWNMNTESAKKVGHPAPFPIELPHRLIQLYTFSGDMVLDPFMGSGTTAIAALQDNRKYVGYEIDPQYIELAEKRIAQTKKQVALKSQHNSP